MFVTFGILFWIFFAIAAAFSCLPYILEQIKLDVQPFAPLCFGIGTLFLAISVCCAGFPFFSYVFIFCVGVAILIDYDHDSFKQSLSKEELVQP